jgi:hypothetical protein
MIGSGARADEGVATVEKDEDVLTVGKDDRDCDDGD